MSAQATQTVADRKSEFVPVTGGGETTSAGALLIVAYILMWTCVFALVWMSIKRIANLSGRLDDIESQLKKQDEKSSGV